MEIVLFYPCFRYFKAKQLEKFTKYIFFDIDPFFFPA